jgi:hypothetical protein
MPGGGHPQAHGHLTGDAAEVLVGLRLGEGLDDRLASAPAQRQADPPGPVPRPAQDQSRHVPGLHRPLEPVGAGHQLEPHPQALGHAGHDLVRRDGRLGFLDDRVERIPRLDLDGVLLPDLRGARTTEVCAAAAPGADDLRGRDPCRGRSPAPAGYCAASLLLQCSLEDAAQLVEATTVKRVQRLTQGQGSQGSHRPGARLSASVSGECAREEVERFRGMIAAAIT